MKRALVIAAAVLLIGVLFVLWLTHETDRTEGEAPPPLAAEGATAVERGRTLALLGNCKPCHTAQGGEPFAGGRAVPTKFGTFYSPNITPDEQTGIGSWTEEDFWRAIHNGYSKDGRPLYPTFPYTNYTKMSRRDARDLFEYLRTLPAVRRESREHELRFPYNQRLLLRAWRRLYFRAGVFESDPTQSAEWNRGAYLVTGVGHCSACHEARNALGASESDTNPAGGLVLNWYAPSLTRVNEAGLQRWTEHDIVTLLSTGRTGATGDSPHVASTNAPSNAASAGDASTDGASTNTSPASDASPESASAPAVQASTLGPMAEVVYESLQHVAEPELRAMAVFLKSLPERPPGPDTSRRFSRADRDRIFSRGQDIYKEHCARCHGDDGEGRPPAAAALRGNRAVTLQDVTNPIRIVLYGGYPPGTEGNPRPFGMPPFSGTLSNAQIADVLSYTRNAWGNSGSIVTPTDVVRNRTGPLW